MMIGRETAIIDNGARVTIYATNMIPESFDIPPGLTPERREEAIKKQMEAYEEKRKIRATEQGVLLDEQSMKDCGIVRLLEGFKIFLQYEQETGACDYQHDVIYAGEVKPDDLRPGHAEKLETLGWHWNDEYECWQHF